MITRSLRYPPGWPGAPAQEKGVDVALAVDFVKLTIEGEYDVGVMMSTDNDLLPTLEVVRDYAPGRIHVAVSAWSVPRQHQRLRLLHEFTALPQPHAGKRHAKRVCAVG